MVGRCVEDRIVQPEQADDAGRNGDDAEDRHRNLKTSPIHRFRRRPAALDQVRGPGRCAARSARPRASRRLPHPHRAGAGITRSNVKLSFA